MQVTETNSDGLKREYKVVIPAQDIEARLDKEVAKLQGQIKMPGFRPGKAPLSLLKKLHGKNLMGQVLEETVNETSLSVLEEKEVRPAMQPKIAIDESYDMGKDLTYTMEVEMVPAFDLPDLGKIKLERLVAQADTDQLDEALQNIASEQKNFKKAAKTYKAATGDAVLMDFLGKIDGEAFEGGAGEGHQLEIGSNSFIPGFEDQLVGVKAGDKKDVKVTFPLNYQAENLAGKDAVFEVTVHEVRKPAEVEINDEMAVSLGLENLEALKSVVSEQISKGNESLSRTRLKRSLLDVLADMVSFEVPASMVEMEFEQIWNQLKMDLHRDALADNPEIKPEDMDEPGDDVKDEYQTIAVRRVRLGLLLSEIGTANDVNVAQEEVTRKIAEEARRYPGQEKQVFEFYQKNPQAMAQVRAPLYEEKVVDYILELAKITDKVVTREALIAAIEEEDEADAAKKKAPAKKKASAKKAPAKKAAAKKEPAKKAAAKKVPAKKAKADK